MSALTFLTTSANLGDPMKYYENDRLNEYIGTHPWALGRQWV